MVVAYFAPGRAGRGPLHKHERAQTMGLILLSSLLDPVVGDAIAGLAVAV